MLNTDFLGKWFSGKALVNAQEAMKLLDESITLGYWAPKASVKVPAALSKSNVLKKLGSAIESAIKADTREYYNHPMYQLSFMAYFGQFGQLVQADTDLAGVDLRDSYRMDLVKLAQAKSDFAPVVEAINKLNAESDKNKKRAKAREAGEHAGVCACCFNTQQIKPSGTMYKHGYQRPGWGYVVGGCPGENFPPYELA